MRDPRDRSASARLLVSLMALGLVVASCGGDDGAEAAREGGTGGTEVEEGGTVTFAAEQEPAGWNINTATDSDVILQHLVIQVYPSVFNVLPDLTVELNEELMESAELTSEDPQVVEYVIKEEAVWSDGTPISADDLVYRWENSKGDDPEIDVATTIGYELIESLDPSDDGKTVTATFSSPYADWQGLFDNLLPAHIMSTLADDPVTAWNDGLDGTDIPEFSGGPWMLTDYVPEQSVTLVPNEGYWGEKPKLDSIVVRFGIEAEAIPQALENEEIDLAYPQPQIDLVSQIEALAPEVEATTVFGTSYEHLDFNLDNPLLGDLAVRQAIAYGLDREGIVERTVAQFDEDATQLDNSLWLTNQEQYEPHGEPYAEQDLDAARSTLEEAGYTEGSDGIYEQDGERLSFRISTTGGNALREATQQVIQSQLAEVGIEITIDNIEGRAVFGRFFPESNSRADLDYDMALYSWVGTPFSSDKYTLYKTPDPPGSVDFNTMGYSNPEVDELFEEAAVTTDQQVVADNLNQVDELLWEDLPTIPLYQKPSYFPFRSSIQGIQDNPSTYGPLWNADEWSLAAG